MRGELEYSQVEDADGEATGEGRKGVAEWCNQHGVAERKKHEEVREELVGGCSRRMSHLEEPSCGYELAAVPPRYRAVHGEEIDNGGNG